MTDGGYTDFDCLYAKEKEPLLEGHPGNARRRATLDKIRSLLESKEGEDHSLLLEFVGCMEADSSLAAWEKLYRRLGEADPPIASLAALEYRVTRKEIWGAMKTGVDIIPHLHPICVRCDGKRVSAIEEMREELSRAVSHVGKSVKPGPEMRDYIVSMVRFDSAGGDEMAGLIVDELYVRRGMLEEACDICEDILGFEGPDRDMAAASTLVEDTVQNVLGHLDSSDAGHHALTSRCRDMLERRSSSLGLGIRPNLRNANTVRSLSEFATSIFMRKRLYTAEELGKHIKANYPKSHEFLGLGMGSALQDMVGSQSPLASNISASIDSQKVAAARKVPSRGDSALTTLEPMLWGLSRAGASPGSLKRWAAGIRGAHLWECLFEIEMYLRLSRVGARVTLGSAAEEDAANFEFNGCHAEICSPVEADALEMGSIATIKDQATSLIEQAQSRICRRSPGGRETVVIIECPPLMYASVTQYESEIQDMLEQTGNPGGVLFVHSARSARREHHFVQNPAAAAPIPITTRDAMDRAMILDLPAIMALDSRGNRSP